LKICNYSSATFFSPQFRNLFSGPQYCGNAEVQTKVLNGHLCKNSGNCWVMAWDCGAGHKFDFLICCYLVLNTIPFLVSTVKLMASYINNRRSGAQRYLCFAYSIAPHFAHRCRWQHSANNNSCGLYKAPILLVLRCSYHSPYYSRVPNLPINWALLAGNKNEVKPR
jgi:hypothetical protein